MKKTLKHRIISFFLYALAIFVLVIQFYPIFWIFTTSFKTPVEAANNQPYSLPSSLNFANYK